MPPKPLLRVRPLRQGDPEFDTGREELAAPLLARATELGYPNHRYVEASLLMMRGDIDAAFAKLKITFADPGADPAGDRLDCSQRCR